MLGIASRLEAPWHLIALVHVHVHYTTQGIITPSYHLFTLLPFCFKHHIVLILLLLSFLSLHTSKRSLSLKNEYANVFFFFCPQYEGSVNKYYFFVTNVKTQTFYRIVQFFFLLFLGDLEVFPFRKKRGEAICQHVVFRIVPAYVVVLLSFQMKIYMNIYEDNTSLKLQVWLRCLSSTYYNFFF